MIIKWSGAQAVRACGHVVSAPARDELLVDFLLNRFLYKGVYCMLALGQAFWDLPWRSFLLRYRRRVVVCGED